MKQGKGRNLCRIYFIAIILGLSARASFAQNPGDTIWTRVYGMEEHDVGEAVSPTSDGGFILCGLGVIPNYNLYDFLLVKTDSAGNQIWTRYYGGPYVDVAKDIEQTTDGGYICIGYTSIVVNEYDIWLLKTDANGDTVWAKTYGGTNNDFGYSVEQTPDGGYILCGENQGGGQAHINAYLVKTYANGNIQWEQEYGGNQTDEYGYCVTQTSDGGFILAGKSTASGDADVYVVKTNFSGGIEWENTYGGSGNDVAWSVIENSDGDFVIAGETFSFGGYMRAYVLKVSPTGSLIWQRDYGFTSSQRAKEIAQTIDGGYAIFGGIGPYPTNDVYVIRTDSLGTIIWEENYGDIDHPDYGWGGCIADDTVFMAIGDTKSFGAGLEYDFWLLAINSGLQGEPRGACCDSAAGICEDNVLQSQCTARFAPDTLCADLDPPCPVGGGGCDEDELVVKIMTDNFPEETTWQITDENFIQVGSGGPYPGLSDTLIVDTVCVDSQGCYNFVIYDSGGNGIGSGGYYQLWLNSGLVGADYNFDGDSASISYVGNNCIGLGACCDDLIGECDMYVDNLDCQGADQRFIEYGFCDDFDPPCGGCPEDMMTIHVMTDDYPDEISWVLRDNLNSVVAQGGPYPSLNNLYVDSICVESLNCYSFTIYDSYGDGIFPPGYFAIYFNDSLLVLNNSYCADSFTVSHLGNGCGPVLGACCDDSTSDCNEDIEERNCQGSSMRFLADGQCDELNPPCGGCSEDEILIEIMPDDYPLEITWALTMSGTSYVVDFGGPLDAYNTLYRYYYCAPSDSCYDFYIFDSEGDGICCDYGTGYYRIYLNGALIDSGGQYLTGDTVVEIGNGCGGSGCDYVIGDANNSGTFNGLDVTFGVAYFKGGPIPPYECECTPGNNWYVAGDVNGSCNYNGLDITYAVAYFKGGPGPMPCPDCPPQEMILGKRLFDVPKSASRKNTIILKGRKLVK